MAASQLLFYMNCKDDYPSVVRALIRTLNCNREVQYVILSNIASLTIEHRNLFEPYLRTFFVYSTDSLQVKLLKLEILSSLITETSSSVILREFQVSFMLLLLLLLLLFLFLFLCLLHFTIHTIHS
ncbi:unnamed protein product [Trichobilharzia regenti]|nr:unnamed protein product [Trichobilharzia regenti]